MYTENPRYRLEANDLDNLALWMADFKTTQPNAAGFRIEMPFNAEGLFDGVPPEVDPITHCPYPEHSPPRLCCSKATSPGSTTPTPTRI